MRPPQSRNAVNSMSEKNNNRHAVTETTESSLHSCGSSPEAPVKEILAPSDGSLISNLDHDESFRRSQRSSALHAPPVSSIRAHQQLSSSNKKAKQEIQAPVQTRFSFYDSSFVSNEDSHKQSSVQKERNVWSFYAPNTAEQQDTGIEPSYQIERSNMISSDPSRSAQKLRILKKSAHDEQTAVSNQEDQTEKHDIAPHSKSKLKAINGMDKSEAPSLDEANSTGSKTSSIAPSLDEGNAASKGIDDPRILERAKFTLVKPSLQVQTTHNSVNTGTGRGKNNHDIVGDSPLAKRLTPRRRNGEGRFTASVRPNFTAASKSAYEELDKTQINSRGAAGDSKATSKVGVDGVTGAPSMDEGIDDSISSGEMPQRLNISKTGKQTNTKPTNFEIDDQSTSVRTGAESCKSDFTYR